MESLLAEDALANLLGLHGRVDTQTLNAATAEALPELGSLLARDHGSPTAAWVAQQVLLEEQFGAHHFALTKWQRGYYRVRPVLPSSVRARLRRLLLKGSAAGGRLGWPVEERFVRFMESVWAALVGRDPALAAKATPFWPGDATFAVVLTHDVESAWGLANLNTLLDVELERGFRSAVNIVAGDYPVPPSLPATLRSAGFEVGVHGWRHDGRLFSSPDHFLASAKRINDTLRQWTAVGFRSPMTHRNPEWMQELDIEWDSSFFDTDPFEPMGGGVMSIWPYAIGRFVELPYTLAQDHTLMQTLGDTSPECWLVKLRFIAAHRGMALLNTHPEYLCHAGRLSLYERFLDEVRSLGGYWHALPSDVARWCRMRSETVDVACNDTLGRVV
jgi:peptidoglycan/xylan/chitin deacetylase (PgdA/CDA1 family)